MPYWWVNQGQTYDEERAGSYLWSPKRNRNGHRNASYELMPQVRRGDVVLHHAGSVVRSISTVVRGGYSAQQPEALAATGLWDDDGWQVDVRHRDAPNPVDRSTAHALGPQEDCFDRRGYAKLAYLFRLTDEFGAALEDRVGTAPAVATPGTAPPTTPPPRTIGLEAGRELEFAQHHEQRDTVATRSEWQLVDRFVASIGREGLRRRYDLPGGTTLYADLWLPDQRILVEAKADSGRSAVRLAIGQLADYAAKEDAPVRKLLLLPEPPPDDLIAVLHGEGIVACWPDDDEWVRSDTSRSVWRSG